MSNKCIIALDQGSSSSRAIATDLAGVPFARMSAPVQTLRPQVGWAEMDARALLNGQLQVLQKMAAQIEPAQLQSIAVASQRSSIVFWDRITGEPLAPVLSWQDGRATGQIEQVSLPQEEIHHLTGLYKTPFYSAAKIKWVLENNPAVAQSARQDRLCMGPTASYIIWHLTGGKVFACDPTLAQRTLLFNLTTLEWEEKLLKAFSIQRQWLPRVKRTCDDYGQWNYKGHSFPINVCVGDQQAALYALHVVNGSACINYGTGAFFMRHTGPQCRLLPGLLTSIAASDAPASTVRAEYLLEGTLNACGSIFSWLNAIGVEVCADELDAIVEKAKSPIWFLPALGGLGAPYWDFTATPVMVGFSAKTTRADIVAGAVNAIAYLMADIVFYAERFGIKNQDIKVSGGLANSRALLQVQANVLQTRLLPCTEHESTAVGAALLSARALGKDIPPSNTLQMLPSLQPEWSFTQAAAQYQQWQDFVRWCKLRK